MSDRPLPPGWIQQYDSNYRRTFWVDTRADPPRSIWVHPCEDEEFLAEQSRARGKERSERDAYLDAPPSYDVATGGSSAAGPSDQAGTSSHTDHDSVTGESSQAEHRRGVFGRLKDKAIGTKEEREEHKRVKAERAAQAEERAREERRRAHLEREERRRIRAERAALAEEQARQAQMRELEEREAYMRAYGGYAPYRPSYPEPQRSGVDSTALIMGSLLGGLLLGDVLGGGLGF